LRRFSKVTILLTLISAQFAFGADAAGEKSKLIALENAWNQAQLHRDGQALATLISDNFVYTDWDGTVMNKAKFMADIQDPAVETTFVANQGVDVYLYPGVAIVTGAYHTKGKYQGKSFDHHGRFTDTWIRTGEHWQCVASHTNLVKSSPPAAPASDKKR
jgi:ketosteroid isomerase-like protein